MKYAISSGATRRHGAAALIAAALASGVAPVALARPSDAAPVRAAIRPVQATTLADEERLLLGRWRITAIAGRPAVSGSRAALSLDGLRLSGSTGCNSLGGSYRFERGFLTTGGIITTRRGCSGDLARQEKALLTMLDQRLEVRPSHRGRLILSARDGRQLILVRDTHASSTT
ncbi:META domain-containing protein [Sphingomonas sp. RS6]